MPAQTTQTVWRSIHCLESEMLRHVTPMITSNSCRLLACTLFSVLPLQAEDRPLQYPVTKTVDQVDDFHGTQVADS